MNLRINDIAPDFTAETTHGTINFRRLNRFVLTPQELYASVHDRARNNGRDRARIRETRRQNHRHLSRSRFGSCEVAGGHKSRHWPYSGLPADRGSGPQDCQAIPDAARCGRQQLRWSDAGRQRDGAFGLHGEAPSCDASQLEAGRRRDHHTRRQQRGGGFSLRIVRNSFALPENDKAAEGMSDR